MGTYGSGTLPLAVAHRGGAGLALENTMAALGASWALGVHHLEVDVRCTADGVPVLLHDASLRTGTGRMARIIDVSVEELRSVTLAGGHQVPTLAQVLLAYPQACLMVDLKDPAAAEATLGAIRDAGATDRVCLTGGWDGWLARARDVLDDVATALGWRAMAAVLASGRLAPLRACTWRPGATFAHVPLRLGGLPTYTPTLVRRSHDLGLRLLVWGVESPTAMHRLLDDGVDGIITDRPDLLREVLVARGQWPTAPSRGTSASARAAGC